MNKTVYAMNHIVSLIEKKENSFQDDTLNVTINTAECLTALVNLTYDLIHIHGIDSILIQQTKQSLFRSLK